MPHEHDLSNALLQQQINNHAETMEKLGELRATLRSVHDLAVKTNGRVTKTGQDIAGIKAFKNRILGGSAVVCLGVSVLWQLFTGKG